MTTQEELDWMIVDGANGLEILWFLICNEPVLLGIGCNWYFAIGLSWWCDKYLDNPKWNNDEWLR